MVIPIIILIFVLYFIFNNMKNTERKKQLELYRASLPHGSIKEVAKMVGVTNVAVSQFLRGEFSSEKIENGILKYIGCREKERNDLLKKAGFLSE